ncbi:DUF3592 domain-containing protein [Kitasatospora cinereorecta]|uniref:DUF3592 domain-containing protein n=1 Tax=Kitasatospora cinereorecta TaxID=285560 RepID=A0ABW0V9J1_9ACTN
MVDTEHTFNAVFGLLGLLFAGAGVGMSVYFAHRLAQRRRALAHGLMAEAVCLETYTTRRRDQDGSTRTVRHAILGFRTFDGRDVRLDRTSRAPHVVGDVVPVRYLPDDPEHAAVVSASQGEPIELVLAAVFGAVFACVGLLFAATGFGIIDPSGMPPDSPSGITQVR